MTEEKPTEEKPAEVESPDPAADPPTVEGSAKDDGNAADDNEADTLPSGETDDTSSTGSEDSDADFPANEDPVEIIIKATSNKEEGNDFFKKSDLDKAVRSYRKGTNLLKPLNKNNTGDEQVKALLVTLQNNLSMVFFKQNKMKVSRDIATKSLKIDPKNVKALYRRAVAHRKMGDLEKARDDLKEALKYEPNNAAVRKEFVSVKNELVSFKEKQKKALAGAFGAGASLYEDKEEEKRKKEEEKKRKKEEEKKKLEERKKRWEDECVQRMAKNEPAISFEDWEKEQKEAEKKKKKEEEERRKAERKARAAARKAAKAESESDDDEELTPSELAMMRGYKKTADGRVTSYFTREQSAQEKKLLGDITPQKLEADSTPQLISPTDSGEGGAKKGRPSVWNQAGTWEEKDTTAWCTERLRERLLETKHTMQAASLERYSANIKKVESLTGDASVAITNGKKRYIFDYHVKLKFEVRDADLDEALADGVINIPDICSTSHDELEVNFNGWKKTPASSHLQYATECYEALIKDLRTSVQRWVEDFNNHY